MKYICSLLIFWICCSTQLNAQAIFQKSYYNGPYNAALSVQQTSDGGYVAAGQVWNSPSDALVYKMNGLGVVEWSKSFGGNLEDIARSVVQTTDGGYAVAGSTRSYSANSNQEIYMARLDASGNSLWNKVMGSSVNSDQMAVHKIIQASDGGFVLGGWSSDQYALIYIKTDSLGNFVWGKQIVGSAITYGMESIQENTDGGFIITGNGGWLIRTDSTGDVIWMKQFPNVPSSNFAQQTSDGGFMMVGGTEFYGAGSWDVCLIKTDSLGMVLWSRTYGSPGFDGGYSALQTADDGYIIAGLTMGFGAANGDMYLIKTDAMGGVSWSKIYGAVAQDQAFSVKQTSDGGYVLMGQSLNIVSSNSTIFMVKTDASGTSGCNEANALSLTSSPVITANAIPGGAAPRSVNISSPFTNENQSLTSTTICFNVITDADESIFLNELHVYPNPSKGNFKLSSTTFIDKGTMEVFDVMGKKIYENRIQNSSALDLNLESFPEGIYLLKISTETIQYIHKLVIRK